MDKNSWLKAKDASDFFSMINMYTVGLEKTRELFEQGKHNDALTAYKEYLKEKLDGFDFGALKGDPEKSIEQAEMLLQNKISLIASQPYDIGDPIDWFMTPGGDKQWQSHLGYMYFQNCLIHAYKKTGSSKYVEKWVKIMEDFIGNHPWGVKGLEYDSSHPMYQSEYSYKCGGEGRYPGYLGGTWIGLACATRVDNWLMGIKELIDCNELSDITIANVLSSLVTDHVYVMLNNARRYTPNQFLHVSMCLTKIGVVLNEFKIAPAAYLVGMQRIEQSVDMCVLPDGTDLEQSFNYNSGLPGSFINVYQLFNGIKQSMALINNRRINKLYEKIKERCNFLALITNPLKQWPDIAKGHLHDVTGILKDWTIKYDLPIVEKVLRILQNEKVEDMGIGSINFPYGGYSIMRSGWDRESQYMLFKTSRLAAGHMHEDCNSIFLTAYGRNMLIDSGNYNYATDEISNKINSYFFSSFSHNTICVDGLGQRRMLMNKNIPDKPGIEDDDIHINLERLDKLKKPSSFCWHTSKHFDFAEGIYEDGYSNIFEGNYINIHLMKDSHLDVKHKRQVIFVKNKLWIIIDRLYTQDKDKNTEDKDKNTEDRHKVTGDKDKNTGEKHKYSQLWQFGTEYTPEMVFIDEKASSIRTQDINGPNLLIRNFSNEEKNYEMKYGRENPYEGWYASEYNQMQKSVDMHVKWEGAGEQLMVTLIYPYRGIKDDIKRLHSLCGETQCGFEIDFENGLNINFKAAKNDNLMQIEEMGTNVEMILKIKDDDLNISGISFDGNRVAEW